MRLGYIYNRNFPFKQFVHHWWGFTVPLSDVSHTEQHNIVSVDKLFDCLNIQRAPIKRAAKYRRSCSQLHGTKCPTGSEIGHRKSFDLNLCPGFIRNFHLACEWEYFQCTNKHLHHHSFERESFQIVTDKQSVITRCVTLHSFRLVSHLIRAQCIQIMPRCMYSQYLHLQSEVFQLKYFRQRINYCVNDVPKNYIYSINKRHWW